MQLASKQRAYVLAVSEVPSTNGAGCLPLVRSASAHLCSGSIGNGTGEQECCAPPFELSDSSLGMAIAPP